MILIFCDEITNSAEVAVIKSFLNWQQIKFTTESVPETSCGRLLKFTKGKPYPILIDEKENLLAAGFFGIMDYVKKQGLLLC